MKIYKIVGENKTQAFVDAKTQEVIIPSKIIHRLEVNQDAVDLLKTTGGSTAERTRYLILNLWNCGQYPLGSFDIFGAVRNADENFGELIVSLFEMSNFAGDDCFKILNEVAPLFQKEFYSKSEREEQAD